MRAINCKAENQQVNLSQLPRSKEPQINALMLYKQIHVKPEVAHEQGNERKYSPAANTYQFRDLRTDYFNGEYS